MVPRRGPVGHRNFGTLHRGALKLLSLFAFFALAVAFLVCGCKNEKPNHLSSTQVHAVTREMMRAAGASGKPSINVRLQYDGAHADRADQLFITIPVAPSDQSRKDSLSRLIQSLDRIGTSHNLSRDSQNDTGSLLLLNYQHGGTVTHSVHIVAPLAAHVASAALPADQPLASVKLAIILDDFGNDRSAADAVFALPYPLTLSILPGHAHSSEIAQEAHRRGYEVMLHLPMQSLANEAPERLELRPGMTADDIPVVFDQMMQSVPNASGVNNHQGSQATADPALMQELMPVLQKWNLFYVDSRTTAATVAYDTAQTLGVRSAFRNSPFLDDLNEVGAIRKQLELAFRNAHAKGGAITIGHPHPATLQALRDELPRAQPAGVHLVYASELAH